MFLPESEKFLKAVVSRVKFSPDREDIRKELENHIFDKTNCYIEKGYDFNSAEALVLSDMGDPKELGRLLNKQHNPVIGWLWVFSKIALGILIVWNLYFVGVLTLMPVFWHNPADDIPKSNIVLSLKVNKTVYMDDTLLKFSKVILDKDQNLSIVYQYRNQWFLPLSWTLGTIGTIRDNMGNTYFTGHGIESGGLITKGLITVEKFKPAADMLIISYEGYNRNYRVEIPLKEAAEK